MKTEVRCGTCKHFAFGHRSVCTWQPPKEIEFPSWFSIGSHAMWVDDGKNCKTWEEDFDLPEDYRKGKKNASMG